jgi:hypothetical protein
MNAAATSKFRCDKKTRWTSILSVVRVFDPPIALPNFDFMNALLRQQLGGSTRGAVTPMFCGHGGHDAAVSAAE